MEPLGGVFLGFVQTGASVPTQDIRSDNSAAQPLSVESAVAGVFAVGDVRSGSVKRVGAAIGEGAAVVAQPALPIWLPHGPSLPRPDLRAVPYDPDGAPGSPLV
jgi:hypothetical protein